MDINNLNKSKNIAEFIISLYVYCSENFAPLKNYINNNRFDILRKGKTYFSSKLKKDFLFNELKNKRFSTPEDCLIALSAIDSKFLEFGIKDNFDYENPIICHLNNESYFLIAAPENILSHVIEDKYKIKSTKMFDTTLNNFIQNFMVCPNKIKGINCSSLNLKDISPSSYNLLAESKKELKLGIFSPIGKITFKEFCSPCPCSPNEQLVHLQSIDNEDDITTQIIEFLEYSRKNNIRIIIFPELTIYSETRKRISEWLNNNNHQQELIMVIAGSMHVCQNNEYFSECVVFNDSGKEIWKQKKVNAYQWSGPTKGKNTKEWFDYKNLEFSCLDTPIGRMSISICLDYINNGYLELNASYYVNFYLVPSFSGSISPFKEKSNELGRNFFSSTFYINYNEKNEDKGFMYFPIKSQEQGMKSTLDSNFLVVNLLGLEKEFTIKE